MSQVLADVHLCCCFCFQMLPSVSVGAQGAMVMGVFGRAGSCVLEKGKSVMGLGDT